MLKWLIKICNVTCTHLKIRLNRIKKVNGFNSSTITAKVPPPHKQLKYNTMCQTMTPKIIFLCFITIHIVASFQLSKPSSLTQFRHDSIPKNRYFKSNDDDFVKEAMTKKSRVLKSTPIKNLIHVETLEEFVNIMKDRSATVVVARFYAPWCKVSSSFFVFCLCSEHFLPFVGYSRIIST